MAITARLIVGGKLKVQPTPYDVGNRPLPGRVFAYTSSNSAIARIDADGLVTGVSPGVVTISVQGEGKIATVTISVVPNATIALIVVTPSAPSVAANAQVQLSAVGYDANFDLVAGIPFVWASASPGVATVDAASGLVTAVAGGTSNISASYQGVTGSTLVTVSPPMTADRLVTSLIAAGHDVLAVFLASDLPDGSDSGAVWAPHYRKPGLTAADVPNLVLSGGAGKCVKVYSRGLPIVRYHGGGYITSAAAGNALDLSLGLAAYAVGTFASADGCLMSVQDATGFGATTRRMAIVSGNTTQLRQHAYLDIQSGSDKYETRCTLDARMRSFGMSVKPFVGGERGARYNIQRSADHPIEDYRESVNGRGNQGVNASNVTPAAGANYFQAATAAGIFGGPGDDVAAFVFCRTPQDGTSAILVQRFAEDSCGAYAPTDPEVVHIGDSLGHGISTGRDPNAPNQSYVAATAEGAHASLEDLLPPGWILRNGCWGGESLWSLKNNRKAFLLPLLLNTRGRKKVVVITCGTNDVGPNLEFQEQAGMATALANLLDVIAFIRGLNPHIPIIVRNVPPCWVNGAANPADATEVRRVALNGLMAASVPAVVDRYWDSTLNHTYGDPGDNTNVVYYNVDLTHMTEAGYDLPRAEESVHVFAVAPLALAA